jgi:transcriptional regulator with XRE-family HTH domain
MVKGDRRGPLGGKGRGTQRVWRQIHLRAWRTHRGLSVEALAERAGVSPGLISQIENGHSAGSPDSLEKLAKALNCEVGELLDIAPSNGGSMFRVWIADDDRPRIEAVARALSRIKSPR